MRASSLKVLVAALVVVLCASLVLAQEAQTQKPQAKQEQHVMLTPSDLKWSEAPASLPAGAKAAVLEGDPAKSGPFTMRLEVPDNFKIPAHWHPADEHVTVISGTFYMGMGDKLDETKGKEYPAGSFIMMPAKSHHFAWAKSKAVVQLHGIGPWGITYVNPDDDPRQQKEKASN